MENKRDLSIDILRIFSMLFIIIHHCVINDFGLQSMLKENTLTRFGNLLIVANAIVVVGVNLFFLMSGYCKIHFTWKKYYGLWQRYIYFPR